MAGKVVTVSSQDGVRIEFVGEGQGVTIPASLLLDVDRVFRHCHYAEEALKLDLVARGGRVGWEAMAGNAVAHGDTPWGAIVALARALEAGL